MARTDSFRKRLDAVIPSTLCLQCGSDASEENQQASEAGKRIAENMQMRAEDPHGRFRKAHQALDRAHAIRTGAEQTPTAEEIQGLHDELNEVNAWLAQNPTPAKCPACGQVNRELLGDRIAMRLRRIHCKSIITHSDPDRLERFAHEELASLDAFIKTSGVVWDQGG